MNTYKIMFQIPVSMADSSVWLYEREETLNFVPGVGHLFIGAWIPSIFPPEKGVQNIARQVIYDFNTGQHLCQLHGYRDGSRNAEETDTDMVGWKRHPTPLKTGGVDLPIAEG
jgi:hypothetical protein